jgi:hypothetical protein
VQQLKTNSVVLWHFFIYSNDRYLHLYHYIYVTMDWKVRKWYFLCKYCAVVYDIYSVFRGVVHSMNPIVLHHDLIKQLVSVVEKMEMLILLHFDCKMSLVSLHVQNTVNIVYNSTIFTKSRSWRGVLDTALCDKVCQRLRQVTGFFPVLQFSLPIKLIVTI